MRDVKEGKSPNQWKICTHLNLQPPSSPIASKGEESPEIESFEERIARFDEETPVHSGTVMRALVASALTMVVWLEHPPANPWNVEESKDEDDNDEWSL
jgi:hypothetical protein